MLFEFDEPGRDSLPLVNAFQAGVLLEAMKDLLYQAYVRRGRLQQAMMVRRYFAGRRPNVTPLPGARPGADQPTAAPRVPEHPHPAAVLARRGRVPGVLRRANTRSGCGIRIVTRHPPK